MTESRLTQAMRPDGWLMQRCGRIDGMFSGTEPITDRSSTEGTELCAIVEGMLSCTVAIKILGDAAIGDRLELIAYNALPADLTPDIKGMRYYIGGNRGHRSRSLRFHGNPNHPFPMDAKMNFRTLDP